MKNLIRENLVSKIPAVLVDELISTYSDAKNNYLLGGLRLQAVEGGRFCEAVFRILQFVTTGKYTALGKTLPSVDDLIKELERLPGATFVESIRLHIPRTLRVVYDIRNKRDAAHLGDGIDPNIQDATLVCSVMDWVLAEIIRLFHNIDSEKAQKVVEDLVTRKIPVIQELDGDLKVLNPKLSASDHCMAIFYQCGGSGATFSQLAGWVPVRMKNNLRRTLNALDQEKFFLHRRNNLYRITASGQKYVEESRILNGEI